MNKFHSKFKPSFFCNSCCTDDNNHHHNDDGFQNVLQLSDDNSKLHVSISTWLKSELPDIKVRCPSIFSGKIGKHRHRVNSVEFRYDPLSYALNFDDDDSRFDEFPPRNFSSRLPPSPVKKNVVVSTEITAWS